MKRIINPNNWIEIAIDKGQEKDNIKIELIRFWNEFYNKYLEINQNRTVPRMKRRLNQS